MTFRKAQPSIYAVQTQFFFFFKDKGGSQSVNETWHLVLVMPIILSTFQTIKS